MDTNLLIERAAQVLRSGGLVAFPTETVYGLGADATNAEAVDRIFQVKGRPGNNPLIVHVADATVARRYAAAWPVSADKLAAAFWPGPLTLVLPKRPAIVPRVTAGGPTVALRSPRHDLTLALLKKFDGPLAGPSANRSSRLSPTTAEHVRRQLGESIDLILDGGPCTVGIESTVLDLLASPPRILRPGAVSAEQIESIIGPVETGRRPAADQPARSPGQQTVHYAPLTPAFRLPSGNFQPLADWLDNQATMTPQAASHAILLWLTPPPPALAQKLDPDRSMQMPPDARQYARRLYADLHEADRHGFAAIWVELPAPAPAWQAIIDRIHRATRPPPQTDTE